MAGVYFGGGEAAYVQSEKGRDLQDLDFPKSRPIHVTDCVADFLNRLIRSQQATRLLHPAHLLVA